mgnify:FL=1
MYFVSYELKTADKDYSSLFAYLEHEVGNRNGIHVMRDSWWLSSNEELDVNIVCEEIRKRIGDKDHFFLSKLPTNDINGWLPSSSWDFFRENK